MNLTHTNTSVQSLTISSDHEGQRLDNFLFTELKGIPKSKIYQIVRTGEIRVNKGRVKPHYRLAEGDLLRIPPLRRAPEQEKTLPKQALLEVLEQRIIYEDKELLAINKPSGVAVHGGSGVSLGVIECLRHLRPQHSLLELVHRLDRDTSGCLLLAKKRSVLVELHRQLREGETDKVYLALVAGRWRGSTHKIALPLQKNLRQSGERVVRVTPEGRPAVTLFRLKQAYEEATLMEAKPITGKTHQIRVHAQFAQHPIAGDTKYGDEAFNKTMRSLGLKRLFLHAESFSCNLFDRPFAIKAPLDKELMLLLSQLKTIK